MMSEQLLLRLRPGKPAPKRTRAREGKPKPKPRMIVLAKMKETGVRKTGEVYQHNRQWYEETETFMEPHAMWWIRRERKGDLEKAQKLAKAEGYEVIVYPQGTKNALEKAKQRILELYGG